MLRHFGTACIENQSGLVTISAEPYLFEPMARREIALFEVGLQPINIDNQPSRVRQGEVFKVVYFTVRFNDGLTRCVINFQQ